MNPKKDRYDRFKASTYFSALLNKKLWNWEYETDAGNILRGGAAKTFSKAMKAAEKHSGEKIQ